MEWTPFKKAAMVCLVVEVAVLAVFSVLTPTLLGAIFYSVATFGPASIWLMPKLLRHYRAQMPA